MNEYVCVFNLSVSYPATAVGERFGIQAEDDAGSSRLSIDCGTLHATLKLPFIPAKQRWLCFDGKHSIEVIDTMFDLTAKCFRVQTTELSFLERDEVDAFIGTMSRKGWKHKRPAPKSKE